MVITENITINGNAFVRSYSDEGRYLMRDGVAYGEAIDPADLAAERVYTEGDLMPDEDREGLDTNTATVEDYQAALVELGVSLDD